MTDYVERAGLQVANDLADFVENTAMPGTGIDAGVFWQGMADLVRDFGPRNQALLDERDVIQAKIDAWHIAHRDKPHDHEAYKTFLTEIGYLRPEGEPFEIETTRVDPEIATVPDPSWSCRSPMHAMR